MELNCKRTAGALLLIGAVQLIVFISLAQSLYPGYDVLNNMISDLGVGPTALLFNASIVLFGSLAIASAFLLRKSLRKNLFPALLALAGVGAIGVGLFPETNFQPHFASALLAFAFGGLSAIASYKISKTPLKQLSVALGIISLAALALIISGNYFGIGRGGMERMIVYPTLIWAVCLGYRLMEYKEKE